MGTPTNRTPVRVARGTYSNLNTNKADIQGSEIVYATDENKLYVKEGTDLIDAGSTDISGKQDLDADLTALSSCQTGAATALALLTSTEVEVLDGVTAGTVSASKAVVLDGSKNITGLEDIAAVSLTLSGDLTVNGTTTEINSTTLTVDDKNIELGTVDTPSDLTADGGGITLKGTTDKTILWENDTDSWDFNQDIKTSGTVTDSKGDVRNIPASTNSTIVPADAGKHISITAGITIDASTDFAIGDAVTIFNNQGDGEDETITATGITLYLASDATESGDRTLAGRGVATILCVATDTYVITGAGLS